MKIRIGFVSNSSSVSFCVYGVAIDDEARKKHFPGTEDAYDIEKLLSDSGLEIHYGQDSDDYGYTYIGRSWDKIKDNETGLQFKEDVKQKVKKLFKKDMECASHEEGYYNG